MFLTRIYESKYCVKMNLQEVGYQRAVLANRD